MISPLPIPPKYIKLDPSNALAHRYRGFAYLRKQDWKNAVEDYDALLKGKHNDREPLIRRAYVLMQLKEYDRSIVDYTEIIKENPKDIEAYLGRAYVYEGQNDFAKGIADSDTVPQLDPNNEDAASRKKRLLTKQSLAVAPGAPVAPTPPAKSP